MSNKRYLVFRPKNKLSACCLSADASSGDREGAVAGLGGPRGAGEGRGQGGEGRGQGVEGAEGRGGNKGWW